MWNVDSVRVAARVFGQANRLLFCLRFLQAIPVSAQGEGPTRPNLCLLLFTMLVLHPTSSCDVCYDTYGQENPASTIPCGHIFCYRCVCPRSSPSKHEAPPLIRFCSHRCTRRCISVCRPSVCPLCRKKFSRSQVTKLRTADIGDGTAEVTVCSPVSATPSTSSFRFERRDSLRGKDFDDRVAAHIKETGEMNKEVTERVHLQHAIEATLRAKLVELELERDTLLSWVLWILPFAAPCLEPLFLIGRCAPHDICQLPRALTAVYSFL